MPIIINLSALPIVDIDYKARAAAMRTCKQRYRACLTKFYKTDYQQYRAVCNGPTISGSFNESLQNIR